MARQNALVYSSVTPYMTNVVAPQNLRIRESEGEPPCYLIALGSGKALQFMWLLSGEGLISKQCVFSGSLWCGTPHT